MLNLNNGNLIINKPDLIIKPSIRQEELLLTNLKLVVTNLDHFTTYTTSVIIDDNLFKLSLTFNNQDKLDHINLTQELEQNIKSDLEFEELSFRNEYQDELMLKKLESDIDYFTWGIVTSDFNHITQALTILVRYN